MLSAHQHAEFACKLLKVVNDDHFVYKAGKYAAANDFINTVARIKIKRPFPSCSVNW